MLAAFAIGVVRENSSDFLSMLADRVNGGENTNGLTVSSEVVATFPSNGAVGGGEMATGGLKL